jgi:hypothetical protein
LAEKPAGTARRQDHGIRTQIRRGLFRFVLLDRGARSQHVVVVLERHLNGVVERNLHRGWILG